MDGFLNLNKPQNFTSHDCVAKLRKILNTKKIGHGGTLDPSATGVLPIAIGKATRLLQFLPTEKAYQGKIRFGVVTTTDDLEGDVIKKTSAKHLTLEKITPFLKDFIGKIEQIPPAYSAIKQQGKKLYELARKGIEIKRKPSQIEIYKIEILPRKISRDPLTPLRSAQDDILKLKISCASGTYIRTLANDIGKALGCGAYLQELERTKIGDYKLENAVVLEKLNSENWQKFCFQSC